MASLTLEEGNLASARFNIEKALELRRHFYKRDNDSVATSLNHLGRVMKESGDVTAALHAFQRSEKITRREFGQVPHPITAAALYGIGEALITSHRLGEAMPLLDESLRMRRTFLQPNHPDLRLSIEIVEHLKASQAN